MSRRRLRVLVLVHEELVPLPPKDVSGIDVAEAEWKMEFDVIETLGLMGHTVDVVGLRSDLAALDRALKRFQPDVLFNLLLRIPAAAHSQPRSLVGGNEKSRPGCWDPVGLLFVFPATPYSPTKSPLQYHRRWRA